MRTTPNALDLLEMLSPQVRKVIERETATIHLPAGKNLFLQGDPGDALYVVLSGSLGVYVARAAERSASDCPARPR